MEMQSRSTLSTSAAPTGANASSKEKLTVEVRGESLSLLCAEKALLPKRGDLGANGVSDAADVEQFELF